MNALRNPINSTAPQPKVDKRKGISNRANGTPMKPEYDNSNAPLSFFTRDEINGFNPRPPQQSNPLFPQSNRTPTSSSDEATASLLARKPSSPLAPGANPVDPNFVSPLTGMRSTWSLPNAVIRQGTRVAQAQYDAADQSPVAHQDTPAQRTPNGTIVIQGEPNAYGIEGTKRWELSPEDQVRQTKQKLMAESMGGMPVDNAGAIMSGRRDAAEILRKAAEPKAPSQTSAIGGFSPLRGDAANFNALAQQEAARQKELDAEYQAYAAKRKANNKEGALVLDTDGDGVPDESVSSKYGKFGVSNVNQLTTANAKYNNYLKAFSVHGGDSRRMTFDEFVKYNHEENQKKPVYIPGSGYVRELRNDRRAEQDAKRQERHNSPVAQANRDSIIANTYASSILNRGGSQQEASQVYSSVLSQLGNDRNASAASQAEVGKAYATESGLNSRAQMMAGVETDKVNALREQAKMQDAQTATENALRAKQADALIAQSAAKQQMEQERFARENRDSEFAATKEVSQLNVAQTFHSTYQTTLDKLGEQYGVKNPATNPTLVETAKRLATQAATEVQRQQQMYKDKGYTVNVGEVPDVPDYIPPIPDDTGPADLSKPLMKEASQDETAQVIASLEQHYGRMPTQQEIESHMKDQLGMTPHPQYQDGAYLATGPLEAWWSPDSNRSREAYNRYQQGIRDKAKNALRETPAS